jgi:predicted lipoprotein with Yx(FWY)xxD motif
MVKALKNTSLNAKIVVNQTGRTVYHLTSEKGKKFLCTGSCATIWPPLTVPKGSKPLAGPGVTKGKLGTITRPDGRIQVTYYGLTLYRYSGDTKAGQDQGRGDPEHLVRSQPQRQTGQEGKLGRRLRWRRLRRRLTRTESDTREGGTGMTRLRVPDGFNEQMPDGDYEVVYVRAAAGASSCQPPDSASDKKTSPSGVLCNATPASRSNAPTAEFGSRSTPYRSMRYAAGAA